MKLIKISIVTCTFNSEKYLKETIRSVECQTYKNFEHIFVDGYSSDGTIKILEEYKKRNPDKVRIFFQKPSGISNAMNYGTLKSKGKIINHLHSDDCYFNSNVLYRVNASFVNDRGLDWIYGNCVYIDSKGKVTRKIRSPDFSYDLLKRMNYIPHPSVFIKKEVFKKFGGYGKYYQAMDYDMWIRIGNDTKVKKIDSYLTKFRVHEDSVSEKNMMRLLGEDYKIRSMIKRSWFMKIRDFGNHLLGVWEVYKRK